VRSFRVEGEGGVALLFLEAFLYEDDASALVEYALITGLLAVGVIAVLGSLSMSIQDVFEMTSDHIEAALSGLDPVQVAQNNGKRRWHNKNFPSPTP